ncbi:Mor transcription activator family protein [Clostridium baratii]|uniref:Mor transcription activator family protein n=1 Tax=Clostridium baratii TaxID=1561 RepID=UPI001C0178BA|nr:Mor transcription activator family protein [Clostridium baratii]MBT9830301.1 Mor transcription activator family protein [Clostridium baratii]
MNNKSENYSGIYKDMVEILGEDIVIKIYENYRGQQVTFPMRLYSKKYIIKYLMQNYNGKNLKEMSRKLGYTCNWLQQVINKENIKRITIDMEEKNVL